jgi:hypothetical protein
MSIRVQYQFPNRSEVRIVERAPTEGSILRTYGQTWHVETVDLDSTGGYIVRLSPARRAGEPGGEQR